MNRIALIGAGQRGMIYANKIKNSGRAEICAVVDPNAEHLDLAVRSLSIPPERAFLSADAFFAEGKVADAVIIASMDRNHYGQSIKALELGYHILLEKPISPEPAEILHIERLARQKQRYVLVCHVLRYTPFFETIKAIIDSGELGKITCVQHSENIGNYHMAHSFVRGNWRSAGETSPLIMQKSCHDMDVLNWIIGSECESIASFGGLSYFKPENAPENSADYCADCPAAPGCRFNAETMYLPIAGKWPATVVSMDQSPEAVKQALRHGQYGRCVYRCDNDVCDHQTTILQYKNGVSVTFTLSGFTNAIHRSIKIMCENGSLCADDVNNTIETVKFVSNAEQGYQKTVYHPEMISGAHGGGDSVLVDEFLALLSVGSAAGARTLVEDSIASHFMAYAAEQARLENRVVSMDALYAEVEKCCKT